jgi:hypothetical protein
VQAFAGFRAVPPWGIPEGAGHRKGEQLYIVPPCGADSIV